QVDPNYNTSPYSPGGITPIQTLDQKGFALTVDWDISEALSLKSITAWREYEAVWGQDADAAPLNSQQLIQRLDHKQKSQEFRLNGVAFNDALDYTAGVFLFDQDGTLDANVNLAYSALYFIHGPDTTPSQSQAVYANGTFHI